MEDIHAKADLGRYRIRGFSTFQKVTHFDDLTFLSTGLTRIPLEGYKEKCSTRTVIGEGNAKNPLVLETPIYITGMSYGALSRNAKVSLGKGASEVGTATCTGDGGMLMAEREASDKLIYQILPSRYGVNPHHMMMADAIEICVGQGAKPGHGRHAHGRQSAGPYCRNAGPAHGDRPALAHPTPRLAGAGRPSH